MRVLIVAKTHLSGAFCVGGLVRETGQNARLFSETGIHPAVDTPYEVGEIWEMDFSPHPHLVPPHIEDMIVNTRERLGHVGDIRETLLERGVKVWRGQPQALFDGLIQIQRGRSAYIAEESGIPQSSVGFWQPNQPLLAEQDWSRTRYHTASWGFKVTYVGVGEPVVQIPAGALLRVSLSKWWKPDDSPGPEKCYLQLSGWYL